MSYPRLAFHIGDVLSLITGFDVSLRGEAGYYALQDFILGRPLSYPERLEHCDAIAEYLRSQFPALCTYSSEDRPPREFLAPWLERRANEHGEYLVVLPMQSSADTPGAKAAGPKGS